MCKCPRAINRGQLYIYQHSKPTNMFQEPLSGKESLQIIQEMIQKARNQFSENGHLYLLWGWVIFVCCISQFVLREYFHEERHYLVWLLTWGAVIYQFYYLQKKSRIKKVQTYTDKIVGNVWLAFIITLFLCGYSLSSNIQGNEQLFNKMMGPVFLALYGIPTFLSGQFLRFRPLTLGGIACWALSVVACFIPPQYQILLLALAVSLAWILPGYQLQQHFKHQIR